MQPTKKREKIKRPIQLASAGILAFFNSIVVALLASNCVAKSHFALPQRVNNKIALDSIFNSDYSHVLHVFNMNWRAAQYSFYDSPLAMLDVTANRVIYHRISHYIDEALTI